MDDDAERAMGERWAADCVRYASIRSASFAAGLLAYMRRAIADAEQDASLVPMSDAEATAFEQQTITFGRFNGQAWSRIPTDYVMWLVGRGTPLQRYTQSDRFKRRVANICTDDGPTRHRRHLDL